MATQRDSIPRTQADCHRLPFISLQAVEIFVESCCICEEEMEEYVDPTIEHPQEPSGRTLGHAATDYLTKLDDNGQGNIQESLLPSSGSYSSSENGMIFTQSDPGTRPFFPDGKRDWSGDAPEQQAVDNRLMVPNEARADRGWCMRVCGASKGIKRVRGGYACAFGAQKVK